MAAASWQDHGDGHGPVAKRQRVAVQAEQPVAVAAQKRTKSKLFAPFRTIGLVSPTSIPFASVPLGKTSFQITTSIGRCLQTYDLRKGLNLVFITRPQTPSDITATTAWRDRVMAAFGGHGVEEQRGIWIFKRGKKVHELEIPGGFAGKVHQLLVFGAWIVAISSSAIVVWDSETLGHHKTISASVPFTGVACTMPTYLNKLFLGRRDGCVDIWNISTGKLIYTIRSRSKALGSVTALEASPVLSLLAIAYANGMLVVQNVQTDMEVLTLTTGSEKLPTTSISFRSDRLGAGDDGREAGVMATASSGSGDISFWDLNKGGRRMGILYGAHSPPLTNKSPSDSNTGGGISNIEFLPSQAIIVSSGMDNALKSWIFDETPQSPIPRVLHSRSGHAAPVSTLQFLPSDFDGAEAGGKWLLSASRDRSFWGWSLRRDGQSTEISQGAIRKKAKKMGLVSKDLLSVRDQNKSTEGLKVPTITCMACCLNRDGGVGAIPGERSIWTNGKGGSDKKRGNTTELSATTGWESVVTGHEGDRFARTWFWGRKRAGRWAFQTGDEGMVTAVAVSPCGSFALVGSSKGGIDMFNLQSGIHRQRFPPRLTPKQAQRLKIQKLERGGQNEGQKLSRGEGKHTNAVTGIVVDNVNRFVISCSLDGKIKFWDFATGAHAHELDWSHTTRINGLRFYRSSDLLALSCADSCIRLIDIATRKLVRELWGCDTSIADFTFSNDGRWLLAASSSHTSKTIARGSNPAANVETSPGRSTIRIWDLPTAHLIDAFRLRAHCTSLAFSNTGEYLATSSDDSVGVDIWTNKTLFVHVPTNRLANDDVADLLDLPNASGEGGASLIAAALEDATLINGNVPPSDGENEDDAVPGASDIEQLSANLVTLSLVPKAQWQTLRNLDLIRARNKPLEPPKAPEKAPFFLPRIQDSASAGIKGPVESSTALVTTNANGVASTSNQSRLTRNTLTNPRATRDAFTALLHSAAPSSPARNAAPEVYRKITTLLATLTPSAADLAIRTLDPARPYTEMIVFIDALTARLREKRDFELCVVWMGVWVKCHGTLLLTDDEDDEEEGGSGDGDGQSSLERLREALERWRDEAKRETGRLEGLVGFVGGVLGWVRDVN